MTLNQWVKLGNDMANSKVTGRKVSRYLCSNINTIKMEVERLEAKLKIEFGIDNFAKAQKIANIISRNINEQGQITNETIDKIKNAYPEEFDYYEKYNELVSKLYNSTVKINILPIKERWLSNKITTVDRYPIEGIIKLNKIKWL